MGWQMAVVGVVVAAAVSYLAWSVWRTWFGAKQGCGGTCSCGKVRRPANGAGVTLIAREQLMVRRERSV